MSISKSELEMFEVVADIISRLAGATYENTQAIFALSKKDTEGAIDHLTTSAKHMQEIRGVIETAQNKYGESK